MRNYKVISDIKKGNFLVNFITQGLLPFVFSCFIICDSLSDIYLEMFELIIGITIGIFGLYKLIKYSHIKTVKVTDEILTVKSIFGFRSHEIYLTDIVDWSETKKKERDRSSWIELLIVTKTKSYKISTLFFRNYPELKEAIFKGEQKKLIVPNTKTNKKIPVIVLSVFLGCVTLLISYSISTKTSSQISEHDLTTIKQVLTEDIEVVKSTRNPPFIKLELKDYPEYNFIIDGKNACTATFSYMLETTVKIGDTLFVDIETEQYKKKITKEKPLDFFEKYGGYRKISVYGLRDKKRSYLNLSDYNRECNENKINQKYAPVYLWLGIGLLLYSIIATIKLIKKPTA